ncbi:MAG: HAD domain-containing protein, partial [Terriglobia bacterium]
MLRLLFLDVDGVLNNAEEFEKKDQHGSDRLTVACVERLATIVHKGAVELVVLSSAWRVGGEGSPHVRFLRETLREHGVEIHSVTPRMDLSPRGREIEMWLGHNLVTSFSMVILDDDSDML